MLNCSGQRKKDAADFFLKGNVALNQKNYAEALRLYDEAIAKNAEFSDAYLNKGITLFKMGRASEAHEILTEAIQIDPTLVQANLVRAEAAVSIGKLKNAEADLAQIEKTYRDSSSYHLAKGNLLNAQGSREMAVASYDRAIALNSKNVDALVNRGTTHFELHNYAPAKEDFSNALRLDAFHPQALNNLGLVLTHERKWSEAQFYFDQVLDKNPAEPYSLNNKGYLLLQTGNAEEGRKLIEKSLERLPENGYALRNLGIYYTHQKQPENALKQYLKAIELGQPVEFLYGLSGQAYFAQNLKSDACKIWSQGAMLKDSIAISELASKCK